MYSKKYPKVSVVISVYNADKFLREALDSIINQSYKNYELIIIDDCSTDNSRSILQEYADSYDIIKLVLNTENIGLTKNLNKAIQLSEGLYIARMDADDISMENRLKNQVDFLEANPNIDVVGSYALDIDENGKSLRINKVPVNHSDIVRMMPKLCPMIHPTVLFRKKMLENINFYNEKYRTSQDYELWFRASSKGVVFHNIPETLLKYRFDDNYVNRKSIKYRMNDFSIRLNGLRALKVPYYKYAYATIPLILAFIPRPLYNLLKKYDPR